MRQRCWGCGRDVKDPEGLPALKRRQKTLAVKQGIDKFAEREV